MRTLLVTCTILSLLITGYCYLEYKMPLAQWTKVLNELKLAGLDGDPVFRDRVRWSIVGAQTTWPLLLGATVVQNILLITLTWLTFRRTARLIRRR